MLKILGIVVVSWTVLSVLFGAFIWPYLIRRVDEAYPIIEKDRHLW
jgi:hypothetical protein